MSAITYTTDMSNVDWAQMKERLVEDDFDNGRTLKQYEISFKNSLSCIACDDKGIIGTVRALTDGVCNAYIVDVWTYTPYRRQGIARQMMDIVMEKLQGQHVYLWTDDMMDFYESIGMQHSDAATYEKVVGEWLQNDTR